MAYYLLENDTVSLLPQQDMTEGELCEILDGSVKTVELCNGVTLYTNDNGRELGFPVTTQIDGEDIYGVCVISTSNDIEFDDLFSLIDVEMPDG